MNIYTMTDTLKQKEINLYGSSRLGIYHVDIDVQNCNTVTPEITKFTRGNKFFELTNHLGNVMATVSDKHIQVAAGGNAVVDHYAAEVVTATDYYPFGMQMPQRRFYIDTATYIIGTTTTTTSVIDTTVVELYKHSFSDTPSVHPYVRVPNVINSNLSSSTWTNSRSVWTNYTSNTSMGKAIAFDNSTADTATVTLTLNIATGKKAGIRSFSFYNRVSNSGYRHWKMYINGIEVGDSSLYYPATGGTGNNTVKTTGTVQVKNAVEDLTGSITVLLKLYDHDAAYPNGNAQGTFRMDDFILNGYINDDGGSTANGYQYANRGGYRYGFNGKENDNEVKGEGNQQDYGMRISDTRLGRFLSRDPLSASYPYYTPYQFAGNTPIQAIDLDGAEPIGYSTSARFKHPGREWIRTEKDVNVASNVNGQWFRMQIKDATGAQWTVFRRETEEIVSYGNYHKLETRVDFYYLDNSINSPSPGNYYVTDPDGIFAGNLIAFDARERTDMKQGSAIADGFQYMALGIVVAPVALQVSPALLSFSVPTTGKELAIAGTKALADGLSDIMAQATVGESKPINWYSVGANTAGGLFGLNAFTTAGMASTMEYKEETGTFGLSNGRNFLTNTLINGSVNAVTRLKSMPWNKGIQFNTTGEIVGGAALSTIPQYWLGTAATATSDELNNE